MRTLAALDEIGVRFEDRIDPRRETAAQLWKTSEPPSQSGVP
jgi:hypothetical protein